MRNAAKYFIAAMLSLAVAATAQAGVREIRAPQFTGYGTPPPAQPKQLYIVQFDDPPALAVHNAGTTRKQSRFDPDAEGVRRYVGRLQAKQNQVLLALNLWQDRVYSYGYAFNGVAVKLTPAEANKLRLRRGISRVWADTQRSVATSDSPMFLGLFESDGGLRTDLGLRGEGVIIGVIDSGIAPRHPSFNDRIPAKKAPRLCRSTWAEESLLGRWLCSRFDVADKLLYAAAPAGWRGICQSSDSFPADSCNNKIVGARYYQDGFLLSNDIDENEFISPADADGHGTHIASIAAGGVVDANIFGEPAGRISGVAPGARVAVYKACWLSPDSTRASCSVADLQKAIEDAVADGVDIINYSIGDPNDSIDDPDDLALLAATNAGIVTVVAAGNSGPKPFTIESPGTTPWVISVGATSRAGRRVAEALRVTAPAALARNYESREASFTPRLADRGPLSGSLVLVNDGEIRAPGGVAGTIYDGCSKPDNDAEIAGNIALVQRGACNFDDKIANAQAAGAIAAIVFSNDANLIVMDGDSTKAAIPAVLIGQSNGQMLRDELLDGEQVSLTLDKSIFVSFRDDGNVVGAYSSRGPSFGDSDFLKPDLVAPGTAILGGQSPNVANGFRGEQYQYLSGTSQSAPHVAGTAALIKQAHPDWTPAEIKSALMTTARQDIRKEDGVTPADPFDMGAGHIAPNLSVDPGLLYPVEAEEYDAYLCTVGLQRITPAECQSLVDRGYSQDARDINLPSIAITELPGSVTVQRKVRNPGPPAQYTLETELPEGITLEVIPSTLSLSTGEPATFELRFTSDGSNLNKWHYGSYSWVNDTHRVYSPFVVQPTLFSVLEDVSGTGAAGSAPVPLNFGYTGDYNARVNGLYLPCVLPSDKTDDCTNIGTAPVTGLNDDYLYYEENGTEEKSSLPASIRRFRIDVPAADNELLRVALYDELTDGNDDLDVYLYHCNDSIATGFCRTTEISEVFSSFNADTSDELIDILNPAPGTWIIDVHAFATEGESAEFRLYAWSFGSDVAVGNLTISDSPTAATAGTSAEVSIDWQGLDAGLWLGGITHYGNDGAPLDITIVEIDNDAFTASPTPAP